MGLTDDGTDIVRQSGTSGRLWSSVFHSPCFTCFGYATLRRMGLQKTKPPSKPQVPGGNAASEFVPRTQQSHCVRMTCCPLSYTLWSLSCCLTSG